MSKHFDLSGRVAVITGGARGIGLSTAERLADAGASIAIVDIDAEASAAAVKNIEGRGQKAIACTIDLTDEQAVISMTDEVCDKLGGYDILVCAAGIVGRNAFAWETSLDEWRKVLDVNLTALWLCNREALRPMRKQNRGRIVNIASIAGKEGNPKLGPVLGLEGRRHRNDEVAREGDRRRPASACNSVAPAVIHTPMLDQVNARDDRLHGLEDPGRPHRQDRRGRRARALPGERRMRLQHRRLLRHLRRPGDLLGGHRRRAWPAFGPSCPSQRRFPATGTSP